MMWVVHGRGIVTFNCGYHAKSQCCVAAWSGPDAGAEPTQRCQLRQETPHLPACRRVHVLRKPSGSRCLHCSGAHAPPPKKAAKRSSFVGFQCCCLIYRKSRDLLIFCDFCTPVAGQAPSRIRRARPGSPLASSPPKILPNRTRTVLFLASYTSRRIYSTQDSI